MYVFTCMYILKDVKDIYIIVEKGKRVIVEKIHSGENERQ